MSEKIFRLLINEFETDPLAMLNAKPGLCRVWTAEAIRVAKRFQRDYQTKLNLEAREVLIEPFLLHTFLRVLLNDIQYVCDGAGTAKYPPYFGIETSAPYLQNSTIDPIHFYLLSEAQ